MEQDPKCMLGGKKYLIKGNKTHLLSLKGKNKQNPKLKRQVDTKYKLDAWHGLTHIHRHRVKQMIQKEQRETQRLHIRAEPLRERVATTPFTPMVLFYPAMVNHGACQ